MLLLLFFSKLLFTEQLVTKLNAGGFEWYPGAWTRCNVTIRCKSAARKLQSFLSYLRVNNWRRCQESLQLFLLASHEECETAHTSQPLVTFQTWRNHRLRRIHWLGWDNLSLMVGSDELSLQQAANQRLWSSSEGCTDTKHRQEFLLLLDNVMERKKERKWLEILKLCWQRTVYSMPLLPLSSAWAACGYFCRVVCAWTDITYLT